MKILERLQEEKMISNQEICDMLGISRDTARRDFIKLVDEGAAIRTHGGIALPQFKDKIKAYKERVHASSEDKYKIGKIAASYINKGTDGERQRLKSKSRSESPNAAFP
ncbi:DeoR/GlpR transcriptional regulator, partial [Paenibacillus sp. 28ISP30-2]|nr:DeoR/GlpR transcriptional regulator [Paenibacillus sp. 28ISP30-2]